MKESENSILNSQFLIQVLVPSSSSSPRRRDDVRSARTATAARRLLGHERVDGLLGGPCDAAEDHRLDLGIGEIRVRMTLHPDERTRRLATWHRVFVGPDLRHHFSDMASDLGWSEGQVRGERESVPGSYASAGDRLQETV